MSGHALPLLGVLYLLVLLGGGVRLCGSLGLVFKWLAGTMGHPWLCWQWPSTHVWSREWPYGRFGRILARCLWVFLLLESLVQFFLLRYPAQPVIFQIDWGMLWLGPRLGRFDGTRPHSDFHASSPASILFGLFMLWWGCRFALSGSQPCLAPSKSFCLTLPFASLRTLSLS